MNYNRRHNRNRDLSRVFKDYSFIMVIVLIILSFVVYHIFTKSSEPKEIDLNTNDNYTINLQESSNKAKLVYKNGKDENILSGAKLSKFEKVKMGDSGSLKLNDKNNEILIRLKDRGEIKYIGDDNFDLLSSSVWIETKKDLKINMRYGTVEIKPDSVAWLSQNYVNSEIYLIDGQLDVVNNAKNRVTLGKMEGIVLNSENTKNEKKELIGKVMSEDLKTNTWFVSNNGDKYTSDKKNEDTEAVGTGTDNTSTDGEGFITFTSPINNSEVEGDLVDFQGVLNEDFIAAVEIGGKNADINKEKNTFSLKGLKLNSRTNDIVYKVYDEKQDELEKSIITIYAKGLKDTNDNEEKKSGQATSENFPISNSPDYKIVAPAINPYTTSEDLVTIEGRTPAKLVKKILVNDFQLQQYVSYGSYWKYHANTKFGNLSDGLNVYKIKFYGSNDELLNQTTFTITKEAKKEVETDDSTKTNSGEEEDVDDSGNNNSSGNNLDGGEVDE